MFEKKYRKNLIISILILFIDLLIIALITWNLILSFKKLNYIPYYLILTAIFLILFLYIIYLIIKITDESKLKELIENIRKEEYQKILNNINQKKKKQESQEKKDYLNIFSKLIIQKDINSIEDFVRETIQNISTNLNLGSALVYKKDNDKFVIFYKYAFTGEKEPEAFKEGETLPGEAARTKEVIFVKSIPENYFKIESGLGSSFPREIVFIPIYNNLEKTFIIFELAFLNLLSEKEEKALIELQKYLCEQSKPYYG